MKKLETKFKEKVADFLDTLQKCEYEKIQQVAKCGTLDFIITLNGFSVHIELKNSEASKASKLQKIKGMNHSKAGAFVFILYPENFEDIKLKLQHIAGVDNWHVRVLKSDINQ